MESSKDFGKKEGRVIQVNEGRDQKACIRNRSGERGRHPEQLAGGRGGQSLPGKALRAQRGTGQYPGRALYKEFADHFRRGETEGSQASQSSV